MGNYNERIRKADDMVRGAGSRKNLINILIYAVVGLHVKQLLLYVNPPTRMEPFRNGRDGPPSVPTPPPDAHVPDVGQQFGRRTAGEQPAKIVSHLDRAVAFTC